MKKVVGIGSPIIDEIAFVDDSFIDNLYGSKGGMELISEIELNSIKEELDNDLTRIAGGSSGNTIFALAKLGTPTSFIGKVGNCDSGNFYKNSYVLCDDIYIDNIRNDKMYNSNAGYETLGIDIDDKKVNAINDGKNYINDVSD